MLLLMQLLACQGETDTSAVEPTNTLVIVLDTFRHDQVHPDIAPNIHRHATESWWPQSAWAPSPWTIPSLSAFLTGQAPWSLGSPEDHGLPESAASLPERLSGYSASMISTNAYVTESRGFAQGFDRFSRVADDTEAVTLAKKWWASTEGSPQLLVVQLMTPHLPYEPTTPPESKSERVGDKFWDLDNWDSYQSSIDQAQIGALYRAQIGDLDAHVGELLDLVGPQTTVALVSDHGEELFEHGGFEHGHAFWEEVTRVHAAIRVYGQAPKRPEGLWTLQDVGQQLAFLLNADDQQKAPGPRTVVFHGHPLSYRDSVLHQWGIRTETDQYFQGMRPHQSLGGSFLVPQLEQFVSALNPPREETLYLSDDAEEKALQAIGYQVSTE